MRFYTIVFLTLVAFANINNAHRNHNHNNPDKTFRCYSCQGGYNTGCAKNLPKYSTEECTGKNAQCYEAVKWFQNGAIKLVERRCWNPPANATGNYCQTFKNPVGKLMLCNACNWNNCNNRRFEANQGRFTVRQEQKCIYSNAVQFPEFPDDTCTHFA